MYERDIGVPIDSASTEKFHIRILQSFVLSYKDEK